MLSENPARSEEPGQTLLFNEAINFSAAKVLPVADGYSLIQQQTIAIRAGSKHFQSIGYGTHSNHRIAFAKARSEAIERLVMCWYADREGLKLSSNGWACHQDANQAIRNSVFESIERDVALSTWLNEGVYYIIPKSLWPESACAWLKTKLTQLEFSDLVFTLSQKNSRACVSAFLFNQRGNCVVGHASGESLKDAMISCLCECFRAASNAIKLSYFQDVRNLHESNDPKDFSEKPFEPVLHSLAYAYLEPFPLMDQLQPTDQCAILHIWRKHLETTQSLLSSSPSMLVIKTKDHFVAKVSLVEAEPLWWGPTPKTKFVKNFNPHIVA